MLTRNAVRILGLLKMGLIFSSQTLVGFLDSLNFECGTDSLSRTSVRKYQSTLRKNLKRAQISVCKLLNKLQNSLKLLTYSELRNLR
jgi:hypothetical protein